MCDEVDRPRKRPDRAAKLKARRELRETVVKSCLRRHVRDADRKDAIVAALRGRVDAYSKRVSFASVALQTLVKEAFDGVDDVCAARLPEGMFTQTFVRQLMLGVRDAVVPDPDVAALFARHPELAPGDDVARFLGDANVYSAGAIKLLTNLKNSLVVNLERRVRRFARDAQAVWDLSDEERVALAMDVLGWSHRREEAHGCCYPARREVADAVREQRRVLGLGDEERVGKGWFVRTANLANMLRHVVALCRFEEAHGLPTVGVTPLARVRRHFVTVDTSVLYGLARELGFVGKSCDAEAFADLADHHWRSIFDVDRLAGRGATFTRTIETDGTAWCVHFVRPVVVRARGRGGAAPPPPPPDPTAVRCVGIDPGRENVFYAAERCGPDLRDVRTWRLTRRRYYRESGAVRAIRNSERWNRGVKRELTALAEASPKGVDVVRHAEFVAAFVATFPALWAEYSKPRWAEQRLRLYGGKKRVFARFFERVRRADATKDVVVAYGSARYAPGGRFELSVPTSRAFAECARRFETRAIDEYRTTMVHCDDDSILQRVRVGRGPSVSRDLLWCCSTGRCKFVNRDKNAALNILRCMTAPRRPPALTRTPDKRKIRHVVGKTIAV